VNTIKTQRNKRQNTMVTGQLMDMPTSGLPTRGLDITRTGQLVD